MTSKNGNTQFERINSSESALSIKDGQGEYNDVIGDIETGVGANQWNYKQLDTTGVYMGFLRNNSADFFTFRAQMPHSKKVTDAIGDFHIHAVFDAAITAGQTIVFDVAYHVHKNGEVIPASASWATATVTWTADANYSQYVGKIIDLVTNIAMPSGMGYGGMLYAKVTRGNGTFTGELGIASADAHVPMSKLGSINRFTD